MNNGSHRGRPLPSTSVYIQFGLYVKDVVLLADFKRNFLVEALAILVNR